MTPRIQKCREFAVLILCFAIVCALSIWLARESHGGPLCRSSVCAPNVVQRIVTPVYKQTIAYAPAYYRVGAQLQQRASDTYEFRQSAEYLEYLRLKGFEAGVQTVQSQPAAQAAPTHAPPSAPAAEASPQNLSPHGPPAPPDASTPPQGADRYPTLTANCAKCHSGDEPKGKIWLDGSVPLDGPDAAAKRDAIARMLWNGHMPPKKPASDEVVGQIFNEIYGEQ
jgi:hypothetical protein